MPELPEVETIRRDLERLAVGKTVSGIVVHGPRTVRRHPALWLDKQLTGNKVQSVRRKGKFLLIDFEQTSLVVHLRMSGRLLWISDPSHPLDKHNHARIAFDHGEELRFVDPRTFGELWITGRNALDLSHIGRDAVDDLPSPDELRALLSKRRSGLKTLLLNQQIVSGIGNIYSDEILWLAKLRQDRTPDSLTRHSIVRLHEAIGDVLGDAIMERGSSLADKQYVDLFGRPGSAQRRHRVYAREGQPCERCKRQIQRIKIGGRSSFWCPACQR